VFPHPLLLNCQPHLSVAHPILNDEDLMPRIQGDNCYTGAGGNPGILSLSRVTEVVTLPMDRQCLARNTLMGPLIVF
jgi:hypothetical protein